KGNCENPSALSYSTSIHRYPLFTTIFLQFSPPCPINYGTAALKAFPLTYSLLFDIFRRTYFSWISLGQ
ncbi:MAG: hypothetical protein ABSB22_14755, partial [Thermodesulfobacteriota bacterium]